MGHCVSIQTIIEKPPHKSKPTRKADFSFIYKLPDPRVYFSTLAPLYYRVPQQALPVFNRVLNLSARDTAPRKILDVCCSYGINAALLRYDVDFDALTTHFARSNLPPEQQITIDRQFFASCPRASQSDITVLGLDAAPNAVRYAVDVGLLADGWAEDLETSEPSPLLRSALRDVGLVVCTGGVGYIGATTFARIAAAVADPYDLWVVAFVLRVVDYDDVVAAFSRYGLVTEKLPGILFRQRLFTTPEEQSAAVADVASRGLDPTGLEADGWFYSECYVTRPAAETLRIPITQLVPLFQNYS
ncbi:hypothetical protein GGX14DRAFT_473308 [Mycena pura]|uniref:Methyltransferase type 12 n=1 Tax=Mycena pura TaxID=153505 RepID=A0AAD6UWS3_9AGAR|nr:hypothetical protein GGX14DRAFT_473308 [Mycena pura]